ncbi:MAG: FRG domain-containing protein [Chloroflexi bacterium]|nr:MAG: FRG domain-containing protein [Chloroflexota bacterium]
MNEVRVESWNQLNDCLYEGAWREDLGRFRSYTAFRGMSNSRYDLRTGISRMAGASEGLEDAILRAFQKYAHHGASAGDSTWNWLAMAQHHGLMTRLLDWTYSGYVALHFVTEDLDHYDVDGIIWAVDYLKTNTLLPRKLRQVLEQEGSHVFTADMLSKAAGSLKEFDSLSRDPFVAFFEPPSLDARIVNQYALFSLVSSPATELDDWLQQHPETFRRYVIPAELKWEVRDKLDQANITERVLYPGLDGLGRWIKRYYTPRVRP